MITPSGRFQCSTRFVSRVCPCGRPNASRHWRQLSLNREGARSTVALLFFVFFTTGLRGAWLCARAVANLRGVLQQAGYLCPFCHLHKI